MRPISTILTTLGAALAVAAPATAASPGPTTVTAERPDIGRVEAHIDNSDQAIGVISRLVRPQGDEAECYGICYGSSSSRPVAWRCGPRQACDLDCAFNPPVGGCR
jgi:hypothetical protein